MTADFDAVLGAVATLRRDGYEPDVLVVGPKSVVSVEPDSSAPEMESTTDMETITEVEESDDEDVVTDGGEPDVIGAIDVVEADLPGVDGVLFAEDYAEFVVVD